MLQREALAVGVRCFEGGGVGLADDLVEPPTDRAPFDRCDGQAPSGRGPAVQSHGLVRSVS
jgi:hypothetical protein